MTPEQYYKITATPEKPDSIANLEAGFRESMHEHNVLKQEVFQYFSFPELYFSDTPLGPGFNCQTDQPINIGPESGAFDVGLYDNRQRKYIAIAEINGKNSPNSGHRQLFAYLCATNTRFGIFASTPAAEEWGFYENLGHFRFRKIDKSQFEFKLREGEHDVPAASLEAFSFPNTFNQMVQNSEDTELNGLNAVKAYFSPLLEAWDCQLQTDQEIQINSTVKSKANFVLQGKDGSYIAIVDTGQPEDNASLQAMLCATDTPFGIKIPGSDGERWSFFRRVGNNQPIEIREASPEEIVARGIVSKVIEAACPVVEGDVIPEKDWEAYHKIWKNLIEAELVLQMTNAEYEKAQNALQQTQNELQQIQRELGKSKSGILRWKIISVAAVAGALTISVLLMIRFFPLNRENEKMKEIVVQQKAENEKMTALNNTLNDKVSELNEQLEDAHGQLLVEREQVAQREPEIRVLQRQVSTLNEQNRDLQERLKNSQKQLEDGKKLLEDEKRQLEERKREIRQLQEEKVEISTENAGLKTNLERRENEIHQLTGRVENLNTRNQQLQQDNTRLSTENAGLKTNIDELEDENNKMKIAKTKFFPIELPQRIQNRRGDRAVSHNNQGYFDFGIGDYDQALQQFEQAIRADSTLAVVHYNLGCVHLEKEEDDEAIAAFTEAVDINREFKEAYYNLGIAYLKNGNFEEAKNHLDQALTIEQNYQRAKSLLEIIKETEND